MTLFCAHLSYTRLRLSLTLILFWKYARDKWTRHIYPQNIWREPIFSLLVWSHRNACRRLGIRHFHSPQWFFQSAGWWSDDFTERAESLTQKVLQGTRTDEERHVVSERGRKNSRWGEKLARMGNQGTSRDSFTRSFYFWRNKRTKKEEKKNLSCGIRWAAKTWVDLLFSHVALFIHVVPHGWSRLLNTEASTRSAHHHQIPRHYDPVYVGFFHWVVEAVRHIC